MFLAFFEGGMAGVVCPKTYQNKSSGKKKLTNQQSQLKHWKNPLMLMPFSSFLRCSQLCLLYSNPRDKSKKACCFTSQLWFGVFLVGGFKCPIHVREVEFLGGEHAGAGCFLSREVHGDIEIHQRIFAKNHKLSHQSWGICCTSIYSLSMVVHILQVLLENPLTMESFSQT